LDVAVQLEKMTAQVRPRKPWEAVDLGFMMIQQWWKKIAVSWLATTLPVFIVINALLNDHYIWAAIAFWWLLPLFDRIPLQIISRALFGEIEASSATIKSVPWLVLPHLIKSLTIYRFDPGRSFSLPVWQLEKLKGGARAERLRVLKKIAGGNAFGLTFMCVLIKVMFFFSLLGLVFMFAPDYYAEAIANTLFSSNTGDIWWAGLVINFFIFIVHFVVEPFYVAGGFALYINRRTELEGWDIEIAFRQLAQRVGNSRRYSSVAVLCLVLSLGSVFTPVESVQATETAALTNAEAKKAIEEIMSRDEFNNKKTVKRWRNKNEEEKEEEKETSEGSNIDLSWLGMGIASLGEAMLWLLVAALIVLGIVFYLRWSPVAEARSKRQNRKLPRSLFGLEITPESLPDDVGKAAMDLWRNKDPLVALSLLYRGALTTLVHRDGINLKGSATEGDCIRTVTRHGNRLGNSAIEYFRHLTMTWLYAAYAHRLPEESVMIDLSQRWTQHFGEQA
jgi:hypothetical protein